MIAFACPGCGRKFLLADHLSGRKATCKRCGAAVHVPAASAAQPAAAADEPLPTFESPPAPRAPAKIPMRVRRLMSDAQQIARIFDHFEPIRVTPSGGEPPERYRVDYFLSGLDRGRNGKPQPRSEHSVEIQLPADYPRVAPLCKMLTPVFHPNIDPSHICVGDHWTAGERLVDLIVRIGEMLAYQAYNIRSPLDAEAAMWADLNPQNLPTDARNLLPPRME